jgi:hypothetical protein
VPYPPAPVLRKMEMVFEAKLATARSALPSLLKSALVTDRALFPVPEFPFAEKEICPETEKERKSDIHITMVFIMVDVRGEGSCNSMNSALYILFKGKIIHRVLHKLITVNLCTNQ